MFSALLHRHTAQVAYKTVGKIPNTGGGWFDVAVYYLLRTNWLFFLAWCVVGYVGLVLFFAMLVYVEPGGAGVDDSLDRELSFGLVCTFSLQTLSTIGYGSLSPSSAWVDTLVAIESVVGLFYVTLATGLLFARVSRPIVHLAFAAHAVVTEREHNDGERVPTLMFRLANTRGEHCVIVGATVDVFAIIQSKCKGGGVSFVQRRLELVRDFAPVFQDTWTVMHPLDAASPLHGIDARSASKRVVANTLLFTGHDEVYAQTVYKR